MEKEIEYHTTNSYSTLNLLSENTRIVWFVCHGMGHLSRYFIRHFGQLDSDENYIIAPQAPSKYYLPPTGKHVGASWLTRENTNNETENIMRYYDAILNAEDIHEKLIFNFLGYSQGVSVAMRYAASRKFQFNNMILVSGGIPIELKAEDFSYLDSDYKVRFIYGTNDEYLNEGRIKSEMIKIKSLFKDSAMIHSFNGNHDFNFNQVAKYFEI